jgi:hypothetical protein
MPPQRGTCLGVEIGPGLLDRRSVRLPDLVGDVRAGQSEHERHALRRGHGHIDPGPAHIDPLTGVRHGFGVAVAPVRLAVDGVRVEPGRDGEFAGAVRGHSRFVSAPAAGGPAHEPPVGRDQPRVLEYVCRVEVLVAGNLLDRVEQRAAGRRAFGCSRSTGANTRRPSGCRPSNMARSASPPAWSN